MLEYSLIGTKKFSLLGDLSEKVGTCRRVRIDSTGNSPLVVSPEVMVASVMSSTAFVMSPTSARVGLGFCSMD